MSENAANLALQPDVVTREGRRFVLCWGLFLVAAFVVAGSWLVSCEWHHSREAGARHRAQMDPALPDPGLTAPEPTNPPEARPVIVTVGAYVERIIAISVKDFEWKVEFYVWFRWEGDQVQMENNFEIVGGTIESAKKQRELVKDGKHYELYLVVAQITKLFDVSRFPCDDHLLSINIETPGWLRKDLLFQADSEGSATSSRLRIPGYVVSGFTTIEKPHSYKSGRGDPRSPPGAMTTHSQFRCGISIRRPDVGLYIKMFQSLFVACAIALLALFIKPTDVDPRFGLGVGALFAGVANSYITSSLIPDTGEMTLADTVNGVTVAMILVSLVESTISLYLYDRKELQTLSRLFDKVSFWILLVGYFVLNVALVRVSL